MNHTRASRLFVLLALSASATAAAQETPAGTVDQKPASAGATEVANGGKFEAVAAKDDAKSKDATEAQILGGGLLSSGNSRSLSVTGSAQVRVRREANQLSVAAAANYGRAAPDKDQPAKTSVENYQGRVRYDRFISDRLTAFLALSARRDRFQGLDLRLNLDPGLAYYFVDSKPARLWGELGYDLQHDVRRDEEIAAHPDLSKSETRHSARVFAGYQQALGENAALSTGVEYLQAVKDTENWRLNWDLGVTTKVGGNFSLASTFSLKYDNNPLPGVRSTDTTTAMSIVYQLL